jgi:hypothetical protein
MPDPSFSSFWVVPSFDRMLFSYLSTTSSLLPLLCLRLYSVVWNILVVVSAVSGECCAHSCNSCRLSCLKVTRGLGENGRNFSCNMGATQPIGIFLPPPSRNPMQLCGFDILPPSCNSTSIVWLRYIQFFLSRSMQWISSLFPFFPLHPSFPSLFGRVVCRHWVCCVPLIH